MLFIQVTKTDMFKRFLKDRLSDKTDYWVELEVKTRPQAHITESNPALPKRYVTPWKVQTITERQTE